MAGNKSKQVSSSRNNNNHNQQQQSSTSSSSSSSSCSSSTPSSSGSSSLSSPPLSSSTSQTHQSQQQLIHQHQQQSHQSNQIPMECFNCHKPIRERFLLKALDQYWHEDCLKCSCCDCRLGEVGSTLFTKANLILCKRDYLRLFGNTGFCSACNKTIPGFEMVMRAKSNVYHLECFSCFQCHQKFCVGDRFYLHDNKILCEYDFEERMVFANLSRNTINLDMIRNNNNNHPNNNMNGMQSSPLPLQQQHHHQQSMNPMNHIQQGHQQHLQQSLLNNKEQTELCDASSGYGSGDSPFDH